jgi:hypothetical protein
MDHSLSVSISQRSPEMMEDRLSVSNVNVEDNQAEADAASELMPMPILDRSSMLNSLLATTYSPDSGRRSRRANNDGPPPKVQVVNCADGVNPANGSFRYGEGRASVNSGINW